MEVQWCATYHAFKASDAFVHVFHFQYFGHYDYLPSVIYFTITE